jgi:hypothetical protein
MPLVQIYTDEDAEKNVAKYMEKWNKTSKVDVILEILKKFNEV